MRINLTLSDEDTHMLAEICKREFRENQSDGIRYCIRKIFNMKGNDVVTITSSGEKIIPIVPLIPEKKKVHSYPKTCPKHGGFWTSCGCKPEDIYEL